jgi:hypothetical protein
VIHRFLFEKLQEAGNHKFQVDCRPVTVLNNYPDPTKLAVFLGDYDCIILANVPAETVSEDQREAIRANTHDLGCGLVMIGGPESFGAGGWQNTSVEKALPVDADIRAMKVQGKSGLVLIMHASEMADGNFWQKKIAKLAVERLGPADEVGVIDFDFQCKWVVQMQEVGPNRNKILGEIDRMMPGDMMDFDPAFQMAHKELIAPERALSTKHVILISDGDPQFQLATLHKMKADGITVTTVGVACHGANEDQKMATIAKATGGRPYSVKNPNQLPAIYIKESRLVSQAFVYDKPFQPLVAFRSGPTDRLPDPVKQLGGFVRTTPKNSPLVEIPIQTPKIAEQEFPVLAYWHYGLGKGVAFTSDAGNPKFWSRDWAEAGVFGKFWEQVIEWSLRPTESNRLTMTAEDRKGTIRVTVEARDEENRLDSSLQIRGSITVPAAAEDAPGRVQRLNFVQRNTGQYEAEVKAEEAGSYFITAQPFKMVKVKGRDGVEREVEEGMASVRSGITLSYSPEFEMLDTNVALLEKVARITGGKVYEDDDTELAKAAGAGGLFRPAPSDKSPLPLWHWLVWITGLLLVADVALRRVAIDTSEVRRVLGEMWLRLRGLPVAEGRQDEYIDRLRSKKAEVQKSLAGDRAAFRFEAGDVPAGPVPTAGDVPAPRPSAPPRAAPSVPPPGEPDADPGDALERLRRAKKKVWEERKDEKQ